MADRMKLDELILYIAARMEADDHRGRGRIKLAKLLFQIDFEAFARWGEPVTEATYLADELGPAPTEELLAARDLEAAGRLRWETRWDKERLPIAQGRPPDMEVFQPRARELIDETLDRYRGASASEMVEEAHQFIGWVNAWRDGRGEGAPVPFESIFWNPRRTEVEPWENEHARVLAERYSQ
jgi:hypothetical protein